MTPVNPVGAVGHMPDEMPGIQKVVCIVDQGKWNVRVFKDAAGGIASGAALEINIAAGLYRAIEMHNSGQH